MNDGIRPGCSPRRGVALATAVTGTAPLAAACAGTAPRDLIGGPTRMSRRTTAAPNATAAAVTKIRRERDTAMKPTIRHSGSTGTSRGESGNTVTTTGINPNSPFLLATARACHVPIWDGGQCQSGGGS